MIFFGKSIINVSIVKLGDHAVFVDNGGVFCQVEAAGSPVAHEVGREEEHHGLGSPETPELSRCGNSELKSREASLGLGEPADVSADKRRGDERAGVRRKRKMGRKFVFLGAFLCVAMLTVTTTAVASVHWSVRSVAAPTVFSPADAAGCVSNVNRCDDYQLLVLNTGDSKSSEPITITDTLPSGESIVTVENGSVSGLGQWECPPGLGNVVKCTLSTPVGAGGYAQTLKIHVTVPNVPTGRLTNEVAVEGGETSTSPTASTREETQISSSTPTFGVTDFSFEALGTNGAGTDTAGGAPGAVLASIDFANMQGPPGITASNPVIPVEETRDVVVELPVGFVGDPLATKRCQASSVGAGVEVEEGVDEGVCEVAKSSVGVVAFDGKGEFLASTYKERNKPPSVPPVYNVIPEAGYPAQFGFSFQGNAINMFASVVHNSTGYRLRVAAPGIPTVVEASGVQLAFFGDAAQRDGLTPNTAFLTNPADCSQGPLEAKVEMDSWEHPEHWVSKTAVTYPQIEDCNMLQFEPKLEMAPTPSGEEGTSQADEPSAYNVNLAVPQKSLFEETATPDLREAKVTLPAGVSVSPSVANGLQGCAATGPEGIDIPSGNHLPDEAGEGEAIGPDGLSHLTAGHCPTASTLGTVEITTPVLEEPLKGHVYLTQPRCGGSGQPACTEASATNGELYGLYIEAEDRAAGVVIKLPGTVSADPGTGQLTGTFTENPQFPFEELTIHFHGGARAPIANPQACGSFATTSKLTSWGGQEVPGTSPSFSIDWDGRGGVCPGTFPFNPGFVAGTTNTAASAFSPFVLSFSRQDREQDLSGLSVTLPPGLLAKIAGVPLCGEEQANAGTCGPESEIGTASALAGPGGHPFSVSGGRVYLTTGYKGGPFGLSVVVPAVAGPFNLGNVVVRASIMINPVTAQVTVKTDPLPQSRDGVPFRLRTVDTEINRAGFTFNPTNCSQFQVTGTITSAQNASANVSSPFAATGCPGLPFDPSFTASTQGATSKANGASLTVNVAQKQGESDIQKVSLTLPKALPARLTTLQKACTEAQFAANPAGCPEASFIGTATGVTPVLPVPLTGPAILVSHGGAAFPDVEFLLQGYGVKIELDGKTDIKKGITYSKFETIPDAPISSFQTFLPEGPHSVLAAPGGNFCGQTLTMATTITAQNTKQLIQPTKISVTGCGKPTLKINKTKIKHNTIIITLTTTQQGTITITGKGLKTLKKTLTAGTHQLKILLTHNGKTILNHHHKTTLHATIHNTNGTTTKTRKL